MASSPDVRCESPAFAFAGDDEKPTFELKFLLAGCDLDSVEAWARQRLTPDAHGQEGTYQTTSLYLDTPGFDVYHKSAGYRRSKYRLTRYGEGDLIHLERKKRRGDRVRKKSEVIAESDLPRLHDPDGVSSWFGPRVLAKGLQPSCWIAYTRSAFGTESSGMVVRLTIDSGIVGAPASVWSLPNGLEGRELLPGDAIVELKFRSTLPSLFRELLENVTLRPASRSKYRRCVEAFGLAVVRGFDNEPRTK
jgi:hypothetical protein